MNAIENITTELQRNQIKDFIQTELLKRGFLAKIVRFEEVSGRYEPRLEFETESFQTTPVIFKSIKVENFSSSITKEEGVDGSILYRIWISVHVSYETFEGGSNGTKLFAVFGTSSPSFTEKIQNLQIR